MPLLLLVNINFIYRLLIFEPGYIQESYLYYIRSQIPVKCPVSEIIKSRRVQGRECYDVSWEGMDGLETSIVPADLIER